MLESDKELLLQNDSWRIVLLVYRSGEQALAEERAQARKEDKQKSVQSDGPADDDDGIEEAISADRWIGRVRTVEGVPDEELSSIHGKLIAYDLLNFKLLSRRDGLVYQLTYNGRRALAQVEGETDADDETTEVAA